MNREPGNNPSYEVANMSIDERILAELALRHREARMKLADARALNMLPKSQGTTELDRQVHLDYKTSELQRDADYLGDVYDIVFKARLG